MQVNMCALPGDLTPDGDVISEAGQTRGLVLSRNQDHSVPRETGIQRPRQALMLLDQSV